MAFKQRGWVSVVGVAVVLAALPGKASAHALLVSPPPRDQQDGYKDSLGSDNPRACGITKTASQPLTNLVAGQTLTVDFDETINHQGCFLVDFAEAGDTNWQLLTNVPHRQTNPSSITRFTNNRHYSTTVTLPSNITCTNCTLRLRQIMYGLDGDPCPPAVVPTGATYYSCANITLTVPPPPDAGQPPDAAMDPPDAAMDPPDAALPPDAAMDPPDAALPPDAAVAMPDAALPPDAAMDPPDAAVAMPDAALPPDAAVDIPDAAQPVDAATIPDSAVAMVDAARIQDGSPGVDHASPPDAAPVVEEDAGSLDSGSRRRDASATTRDAAVVTSTGGQDAGTGSSETVCACARPRDGAPVVALVLAAFLARRRSRR